MKGSPLELRLDPRDARPFQERVATAHEVFDATPDKYHHG